MRTRALESEGSSLLDSIFVISMLVAAAWLSIAVVVLALCRMAARSDWERLAVPPGQRPRLPMTWGTVRKRILTSPQSDQFATYR